MIENINEEMLQKIIDDYVISGSNIGVHKMTGLQSNNYESAKKVFEKILKEGFVSGGGEKSNH